MEVGEGVWGPGYHQLQMEFLRCSWWSVPSPPHLPASLYRQGWGQQRPTSVSLSDHLI